MCRCALTPSLHGVGLGDGWEGWGRELGQGCGGGGGWGGGAGEFSGRAPDS